MVEKPGFFLCVCGGAGFGVTGCAWYCEIIEKGPHKINSLSGFVRISKSVA